MQQRVVGEPLPRSDQRDVLSWVDEPRYELGDRVCVQSARGLRLPGVVIGHYVEWNFYRVVYMVDIVGKGPRVVEQWRLSPRREGEEC